MIGPGGFDSSLRETFPGPDAMSTCRFGNLVPEPLASPRIEG